MGPVDRGRSSGHEVVAPSIVEIEARVSAAERLVETFERRKARAETALEDKIDRSHAEIMDALRRQEENLRSEILKRLARVESKLQDVA